jgi:hypothetical protein
MTGFFLKIRSCLLDLVCFTPFNLEKRVVNYQHYIAIQLVEH